MSVLRHGLHIRAAKLSDQLMREIPRGGAADLLHKRVTEKMRADLDRIRLQRKQALEHAAKLESTLGTVRQEARAGIAELRDQMANSGFGRLQ